jgi:hypothetical protein
MGYTKSLKEIELEKISIEMDEIRKNHIVAIDPYQKDLILIKWNKKADEYAKIVNEIKKNK